MNDCPLCATSPSRFPQIPYIQQRRSTQTSGADKVSPADVSLAPVERSRSRKHCARIASHFLQCGLIPDTLYALSTENSEYGLICSHFVHMRTSGGGAPGSCPPNRSLSFARAAVALQTHSLQFGVNPSNLLQFSEKLPTGSNLWQPPHSFSAGRCRPWIRTLSISRRCWPRRQ